MVFDFLFEDPEECNDPGLLANGFKSYNDYQIGGHVQFTCNKGYKLEGPREIICQDDLTWSTEMPTCKSKYIKHSSIV